MIKILVTADYEVFGDGTGDPYKDVIIPTKEILETAEKHGSRVTLFVDVCWLWALEKRYTEEHNSQLECIKSQLISAVKKGHDIQLHAHPQWINAEWDYDRKRWKLNMSQWRISTIPSHQSSTTGNVGVYDIIYKGKEWLENLLIPIDCEYRCTAFRAGAWCIQPEKEVLKALSSSGLLYDTSVAPGGYRDDGRTIYDFRLAPQNMPFWPISCSVTNTTLAGPLTEIPIYTQKLTFAATLLEKIYRKHQNRKENKRPSSVVPNRVEKPKSKIFDVLKKVINLSTEQSRVLMLDYCALSSNTLIKMLKNSRRKYSCRNHCVPVVAIGHPKNLQSTTDLDCLLRWTTKKAHFCVDSISEKSVWREDEI